MCTAATRSSVSSVADTMCSTSTPATRGGNSCVGSTLTAGRRDGINGCSRHVIEAVSGSDGRASRRGKHVARDSDAWLWFKVGTFGFVKDRIGKLLAAKTVASTWPSPSLSRNTRRRRKVKRMRPSTACSHQCRQYTRWHLIRSRCRTNHGTQRRTDALVLRR